MGHDITAKRPSVDATALWEKFDLDNEYEDWAWRVYEYRDLTEIAYIRRSARDPLNQVLYLALGVMDEAYADVSGNGVELDISRDQFCAAKRILESKQFAGMTRDRNAADDLMEMVTKLGGKDLAIVDDHADVTREHDFIERCITYLESEGLEALTVNSA